MVERHCRGLWFRKDPTQEWEVYTFNTIQFGDYSAAALMTIAVEKAAETYKEVAQDLNLAEELVKEDSRKLLLDMYVDNSTTGGSPEDISRMLGHLLTNGQLSGTIPTMM